MNMMNIGNRSLCSEVTDKSIVAYFYSLSNSNRLTDRTVVMIL